MLFPIILIIGSAILCIRNTYPVGMIALTNITALVAYANLFLHQNPSDLISTMLSPALLTVMCMMVMGHALTSCGITTYLSNRYVNAKTPPKTNIAKVLIISMLLSTVISNTTVVIMMTPVMHNLAQKTGISESKLMMPLAFASSLGGMLTVLGSSTNLLIKSKMETLGYEMHLLDFILPGLIITIVGMYYVIKYLPKILTDKYSKDPSCSTFTTEILIKAHDPLIGQTVQAIEDSYENMKVIKITQSGRQLHVTHKATIVENQLIEIMAPARVILEIFKKNTLNVNQDAKNYIDSQKYNGLVLLEGIIKRNSNLLNLHINKAWIRGGLIIAKESSIRSSKMQNGMTILMLIKNNCIEDPSFKEEVLLLETSLTKVHDLRWALKPVIILIGMIAAAMLGLPIVSAALIGALACVFTKCVRFAELRNCIDQSVVLVIAYSNLLSHVLSINGTLTSAIELISDLPNRLDPLIVLVLMFAFITIMNEAVSNNTVGLIFSPIALDLAAKTGSDPRMFVWGLIFASGCAFSTPIGYQTNLMVMSPGKYVFLDYLKGGPPLTILLMLTYVAFCIVYF